jgi:hypothetical protein
MLRALSLSLLLGWASVAFAEVEQRWLALFEQSYGSEGLYVVEVAPKDEGGPTRLALQQVNASAAAWRRANPGKVPDLAIFTQEGKLRSIPKDAWKTVFWDAEQELFSDKRGGVFTPAAGVVMMLRANEGLRQRLLQPDRFTRQRWKKLYWDPKAPELIRREILLREFMLDNHFFPEVLLYERTQAQQQKIADAVELFAIMNRKQPGDAVSFADLREAGAFGTLGTVPDNVAFTISTIGGAVEATINGVKVVDDAAGPRMLRRKRAEQRLAADRDFPPALALAARFEEPPQALLLLNKAISRWPDVPGLRVERLAAFARAGDFKSWQRDLDYLLKDFPAAPLLIEIELAGEHGRLSRSPEVWGDVILLLADVRPDLLTHQLVALREFEQTERENERRTVSDRLLVANPAWRIILDDSPARPVH